MTNITTMQNYVKYKFITVELWFNLIQEIANISFFHLNFYFNNKRTNNKISLFLNVVYNDFIRFVLSQNYFISWKLILLFLFCKCIENKIYNLLFFHFLYYSYTGFCIKTLCCVFGQFIVFRLRIVC